MRRSLLPAALLAPLAAALLLVGCKDKDGGSGSNPDENTNRIKGGGATFVDPIMQKWSSEYRQIGGVEIDYTKSGSGDGIKQMTEKSLHFGCSDAPMKKDQIEAADKKGGEVFHIPLITGAVAVIYNLPGVKDLKLSGPVVAGIYLGKIKKWNADAIKELNPGVNLPDRDITPVYRSDSSGTTNIFTEYLGKVSQDFADAIPAGTSPKWPDLGLGQKGSDGVSGHVQKNSGCIGYVEVSYAEMNGIQYATMRNAKGKDVPPKAAGVTAAAEWALAKGQKKGPYDPDKLTFSLTNAESDAAYPICGISYCLIYKRQPMERGKKIVEFVKWATSEGQKYAVDLHYAPLPAELSKKVAAQLEKVELVQ
jgi:phosphate transport system substrate-binding protein